MNYSLAVFMLNKGARCISVSYDKATDRNGKVTGAELKSFKSLDTAIKVGDFVVVPTDTRWGFTIGRVEQVDLRVNYNSSEQMRWIVSRVDKDQYENFCKQEDTLIERVADAEEEDQRSKLAAKLMAINPNFDQLSIVDHNEVEVAKSGFEPDKRGGAQKPPEDDDDMPPLAGPENIEPF